MTVCTFCGGGCGRVCRGLGFKPTKDSGGSSKPAEEKLIGLSVPDRDSSPPMATVPPVPKLGRPRLEDANKTLAATKPWVALKMSRRTWYRRRAEKRGLT